MKLLIGICAYNEGHRIEDVLINMAEAQKREKFDIVIGNDGSTDNTLEIVEKYAEKYGWHIINHSKNMGVGATIRDFIYYGIENGYEVFTTVSGNGKVSANDAKALYSDVMNGNYDYVKGSRYVEGGSCTNFPLFRKIAIPLYSFFVSTIMWRKITDVTCLVNALRLDIFKDVDINLDQEWLNKYELEYYIFYYILKKKFRFKEVPINATYPSDKLSYTKIKPITGWWSMVRPWFILKLRIKK